MDHNGLRSLCLTASQRAWPWQPGWMTAWVRMAPAACSVSLSLSQVCWLGHGPSHFLQDAFLARQLTAKPLCSFKIIRLKYSETCLVQLSFTVYMTSSKSGAQGALGIFAHPLLRPCTQQGLTTNICCLREFIQVSMYHLPVCPALTRVDKTVCETPKWSGTWKSYLVTKCTSSRALVHCYPKPSTVPAWPMASSLRKFWSEGINELMNASFDLLRQIITAVN